MGFAPPHFNLLSFPIHDVGWLPNADDFWAYMSRLTTLFLESPYVVAAAFSRWGIAWWIAREVLGIKGSVDALLNTYPDQCAWMRTAHGVYWCHELDEGEWFYLVGGKFFLTGWCCAYLEQGRVIRGWTFHGGLRSQPGREVASMLGAGPQCASNDSENVLNPSKEARLSLTPA